MVLKSHLMKDALCDSILMKYCYTAKKWGRACSPLPHYLLSVPSGPLWGCRCVKCFSDCPPWEEDR